jgi:hypothetical protein
MRARCVNPGSSTILQFNRVYKVRECKLYCDFYDVLVNGEYAQFYHKSMFLIDDPEKDIALQPGTIRCRCGTLTTNKISCCDCIEEGADFASRRWGTRLT